MEQDGDKRVLSSEDKVCKFIRHLMRGEVIKVQGTHYCMSESNELALLCVDEHGYPIYDKAFRVDATLGYIISLAEQVPDEEYYTLDANKVLNEIRKRRD